MPAGVVLRGACVEATTPTSSDDAYDQGVLTVTGPGVEVHDLRIADSAQGGVYVVGAGRSAILRNVVIDAREFGVVALGGDTTLNLEDVFIAGTEADGSGVAGAGLVAYAGPGPPRRPATMAAPSASRPGRPWTSNGPASRT